LAYTSDLNAYRSAPACKWQDAALNSRSRRFVGDATVVSLHRNDALETTVSFDELPGRTLYTSFPTYREPSASRLTAGATAPADLWAGRITDLAGASTVHNPQDRPIDQFRVLGLFFGFIAS
jgi:hypothetical protein